MKYLLLILLAISSPLKAEGFATTTKVTSENLATLAHHKLELTVSSDSPHRQVTVSVAPKAMNIFRTCSVTIHGRTLPIAYFEPNVEVVKTANGTIESIRFSFAINEEYLDVVSIFYGLAPPDAEQIHAFVVSKGVLSEFEVAPKNSAEQVVPAKSDRAGG